MFQHRSFTFAGAARTAAAVTCMAVLLLLPGCATTSDPADASAHDLDALDHGAAAIRGERS